MTALLAAESFPTRTALARRLCHDFRFFDPRGQCQLSTCVAALRTMQARKLLQLPPPTRPGGRGRPRLLGRPVPPPRDVPDRVDQVADLRLELVTDSLARQIWNQVIDDEHPRGAAFHVGTQLRYLVHSDHGLLGAIGFAAAAHSLAARDRFIGWDSATRPRCLHLVLALSRLLVRPAVRCRNLASKTLALCLQRLAADCLRRYGFSPVLLETFVNPARNDGASLRAANWILVGRTAGRGRFAPRGARKRPKLIYLRPLQPDWRSRLGVGRPPPRPEFDTALAAPSWTQLEFGAAPLGDRRWSRRLVQFAAALATDPGASFASIAQADRPLMRAFYRLIDKPAASQVTPAAILAPHRARTVERMRGQPAVLCIQDGTDLNFAERPGCAGPGIISKNKGSAGTLGLHMHSTLAVCGDGVPLGVPLIQFDAPDGKAGRGKPPQERKSWRWVLGLRDTAALAAQLDGLRPVGVMDREADVFALFAERRRLGGVDLLVRAKHDRSLGKDRPKLFAMMRAQPVGARLRIHVPRTSARRGTRRQAARKARPAREAEVGLRWGEVRLPPPAKGACRKEEPVTLRWVHVGEEEVPDGAAPLEWFLLTSLEVAGQADAEQVLGWYRLRWRIEDWHRVLKSGCRVEYLGHRRGERIERAVAIKAVIAWRLAAMTLLARNTPGVSPKVLFSKVEIAVLADFAKHRGLPPPDTLGRAVRITAILGGYLNRKQDRPPGHQVIWAGFTRLGTKTQTYEHLIALGQSSNLYSNWLK